MATTTTPRPVCAIEMLEARQLLASNPLALQPAPAGGAAHRAALSTPAPGSQPSVTASDPLPGAADVPIDSFMSAEVNIPNGGVDATTLTSASVYLERSDGERIPAILNTTGGGDAIILHPIAPLTPKATYSFVINEGVKDLSGKPFIPYSATFRTGPAKVEVIDPAYKDISFEQVPLAETAVARFLGVTVGPDHKLYASTDDGRIFRYPINYDGTLGTPEIITTIRDANNGPRFVVGMAFDPASTPNNPILWVSHTAAGVVGVADWTGSISRLSGPGLTTLKDVIIHLPRSFRDHVTGQLAFGPDGALYFCQPSNTAMGEIDPAWGNRPERLLTAAILRLDVNAVKGLNAPIDVTTKDGGGNYDPYAPNAPLTFKVTGVRNAYDILFHSNGQLYAPTNGSAAGGVTPASPDGTVPGIARVSAPFFDVLYRVGTGKYYGHPNPTRKEYVLQGGNPTAGADSFEIPDYPVGVTPPANFRGAIFNFGLHESPDGLIEYKGQAFGGALEGKILVTRYSGGGDIMLLEPSSNALGIYKWQNGIPGLTGLRNPLDLAEDETSGNVYVVEYNASGATGQIVLLRVPHGLVARSPPPPPPPDPPDAVISDFTLTEPDAGTVNAVFTITLSKAITQAVEVDYTTNDGTATTADDDYAAASGTVHFNPGEVSKQITVQVKGDTNIESDESFDVTLTNPLNMTLLDSQGTATITNNDEPPPPPPPPPPPIRSLGEIKLIAKIQKYGATRGLTVPDLTYTPGPDLKGIFADLKVENSRRGFLQKVIAQAVAKNVALPADLNSETVDELKQFQAAIKAEVARRKFAIKVTAAASKKKYVLPDLTGMSLDELKQLMATIQRYQPPAA